MRIEELGFERGDEIGANRVETIASGVHGIAEVVLKCPGPSWSLIPCVYARAWKWITIDLHSILRLQTTKE